MKTNVDSKTAYLVQLALMVAVTILMSFTPLGYIRLPGLSMSLLSVPVAVAAILLGPIGGLVCGTTFGLTSLYQAITGGSAFTGTLLGLNPAGTVFLTVVARALMGLCAGLIFAALHKNVKTQQISYYVTSLAAPLLNTIFFMSSLVLIFYRTDYIQGFVAKYASTNPLAFVIAFVGVQGLIEAVVCFIVASAVGRILFGAVNKMGINYTLQKEEAAKSVQ